jgi:hypothetical protein
MTHFQRLKNNCKTDPLPEQGSQKKINTSLKAASLKPFRIDMVPNEDGRNMKKLNLERLDAVYINKDVGFYYIKKSHLKNIQYAI